MKPNNFGNLDYQVHNAYKFKKRIFWVGKKNKLLLVLTFSLLLGSVINLPNAAALSCIAPTDGGPITACNYSSEDPFLIIDGLPPMQEIEIEIVALSLHSIMIAPNGGAGEQTEQAMATLDMTMTGTGGLAYNRHLQMPISFVADTGSRTLGTTPQMFPTDMKTLQGQLPIGDPDFDLLRITAGTNFGLPSPGHTTLTNLDPNNWAVDSFFDITYRIDFVGNPGGPFAGMSGSTTGTSRILSDGSSDSDLDGIPDAEDPEPRNPCNPDPEVPACNPIGGVFLPIDNTALLIYGIQTNAMWLIPLVVSGIVIGLVLVRRR
jgi:hypothetical protein